MESESVHIIATMFIFINIGALVCLEIFRDATADNTQRNIISRIICPSCLVISIFAMFGACRRQSCLLLPFLTTLVLFFVLMCGLAVYLIAWCPFEQSGGQNFLCSIAVILGSVCVAGALLMTCAFYVVYSLYKFIRSGGIEDDDFYNATDIELMDRTNKDMFDLDQDHEQYPDYDRDQPSTSYN